MSTKLPFLPADILLPQNCDLTHWAVVACDQYSSQPEYWQRVEEFVGGAPSTLNMILPESRLEGPNVEEDISDINNTMTHYIRDGLFQEHNQSLIYVERSLDTGKVRQGLIGMVDLEEYDYEPGSPAKIRATEGTVISRIPPRVAVRKNAPMELPHILLLLDDVKQTVVEPLASQKADMTLLYDFELMEGGGHIQGWKLNDQQMADVEAALQALADPEAFNAYYGTKDKPVLLFAAGDGNHSLATAKECYERQKRFVSEEEWDTLPARYALCELGNLHDDSLEFEPIHRVIFDTNPMALLAALVAQFPDAYEGKGEGHVLPYVWAGGKGAITIPNPTAQLEVATLQPFLDQYTKEHGGRIDYIHGADVTERLASGDGCLGFLLPAMGKDQLFPTVIHDGVLPRKTFSMGEAQHKRFYLEGRKIR